ncbi:hypothetical protein P692DRAFT_20818163 [Suillus brevipes Sb2]|nr:hypothetical protein P692DRAFT_20818163 [Suillus brevipes Sb2]
MSDSNILSIPGLIKIKTKAPDISMTVQRTLERDEKEGRVFDEKDYNKHRKEVAKGMVLPTPPSQPAPENHIKHIKKLTADIADPWSRKSMPQLIPSLLFTRTHESLQEPDNDDDLFDHIMPTPFSNKYSILKENHVTGNKKDWQSCKNKWIMCKKKHAAITDIKSQSGFCGMRNSAQTLAQLMLHDRMWHQCFYTGRETFKSQQTAPVIGDLGVEEDDESGMAAGRERDKDKDDIIPWEATPPPTKRKSTAPSLTPSLPGSCSSGPPSKCQHVSGLATVLYAINDQFSEFTDVFHIASQLSPQCKQAAM